MKAFSPKIQVKLFYVVNGSGEQDITDWFGDGCSIRTSKSYRDPAGTFVLTFADKKHPGFLASIFSMVSPMDAIEIRAAHDGKQEMKLLMRGFVSNIRREEVMGQDGKPLRRVVITGQDVGKLTLIHWVHLLPYAEEQALNLNGYGILSKYFGESPKPYSANDFAWIFGGILNTHLTEILASSKLNHLTIVTDTNIEGTVSPQTVNRPGDRSYHEFITSNLDVGAFNEFFLEDDDGGATMIVRPNFTGGKGVTITEEEMQSISVFRADSQVANWFWVNQLLSLNDQIHAQVEANRVDRDAFDARGRSQCAAKIYGYRKMQVMGMLLPPAFSNEDNPTKEAHQVRETNIYKWLQTRCQTLQENNYQNALLEQGTIRFRGNENVRVGTWITVQKKDVQFRYYVVRVEHEFQFFGGFFTTVHVERGEMISGLIYEGELNLKGALK